MESSREPPRNSPAFMLLAGLILLAGIMTALVLLGGIPGSPAPAAGTPEICPPAACTCPAGAGHEPRFADPAETLQELRDPGFTEKLFSEAVVLEPLLATKGTQVHMGFYSGKGNHGSLLRLLDAINEGPAATAAPPHRAIWAMGVNGYYQFPSWARLMDEYWYERAGAVNGTVTIAGKPYRDPYTVTFTQADAVWAEYSMRFAEMAVPVAQATGKPVKVWCYVQGAKANRIFYSAEYTVLQKLEDQGVVEVYFARTPLAAWDNPADWINGTRNAPPPAL